jgi:predicted phosphodiesterase
MRLAVLSDIHGNPIALDAVLEDVQSTGGADLFLLLGDLVAIGYDPIGVLERIAALPNVRSVQGNTDRYVVTGDDHIRAFRTRTLSVSDIRTGHWTAR